MNLNTILMAITLGVSGFIAHATYYSTIDIATIKASQVTRPEIETKITEVNAKITDTQAQIVAMNLRLTALEAKK